MICTKCLSQDIYLVKKGFTLLKRPIGARKIQGTCLKCGHKFMILSKKRKKNKNK